MAEETDRQRAKRYRERAEECRRNAANMQDPDARKGLLQVAGAYEQMAENIEDHLPDE
jgi:hypothetical protein